MPATTGRNIAAALISPQAPMPRGRGAGDVPPLRHGPQGPGALVALRQAQGFAVGAHGARALRAKPAPRVRRLSHEQGNPRARFPWPGASSLRPRAPRAKTRASSRSSASSVRPAPFPRSCHGSCGATSAPAPRTHCAPSRSPTWARPPGPDPAKRRKPALRPVRMENDALRSPRTGDQDAALVLTPGEIQPAPRRQASRREDPARCLRGAPPTRWRAPGSNRAVTNNG